MIARKRIIVDVENGVVRWPNGRRVHTALNFWGYERFQVPIRKKNGKRTRNWFFVHKAVVLARGQRLRKHHEINHINHSRADNRSANLEYIHRTLNLQLKSNVGAEVRPAF